MRLRIINGTPKHDETLCDSCANVRKRKGTRLADIWYECDNFHGPILQPVVDCNQYIRKGMHAPMETLQMAWRWVPSVGQWLPPAEYKALAAAGKLKPGEY